MDVQVMQLRLRLSVRKCNLGLTEISFLRPPVAAFRSADKYKKLLREVRARGARQAQRASRAYEL